MSPLEPEVLLFDFRQLSYWLTLHILFRTWWFKTRSEHLTAKRAWNHLRRHQLEIIHHSHNVYPNPVALEKNEQIEETVETEQAEQSEQTEQTEQTGQRRADASPGDAESVPALL